MSKAIDKYFEALKRLQAAGKRINNDTVAVEAGSKKGSIKSGRPSHEALVQAIEAAAAAAKEEKASTDPVPGLRDDVKGLRQRLDDALEREINLLDEVLTLRYERDSLRAEVKSLRSGNLQLFSKESSSKRAKPKD